MATVNGKIKSILIKTGIPLLLVIAVVLSVVAMASGGESKVYKNITPADYELEASTVKFSDAESCIYAGYKAVAKSGSLTMYLNEETSGVAVYDSKTGQTMSTVIPDEEIEKANPVNMQARSYMLSNFILTAVNMETGNTSEYTMYDQLEGEGKFSVEGMENGIRITYVIGKIPKVYIVPKALSEERFLEIAEKLSESDARNFKNRYRKFNIDNYHGSERNEYIEMYPTCEDETIYILNNDKDFVLKALQEILSGIGYTEEEQFEDEAAVIANVTEEEYTVFRIPMEFTVSNGKFSVSVDREGIKYSSVALPVYIRVAPYLTRGYTSDTGYMLLPDGSGSLINLNNGKSDKDSYSVTVYGTDPVYYENFETEDELSARLPVFGIKKQSGGLFAHISEIGAEARISAHVSGYNSDTNYSSVEFKLFGYKKEMVSQDWTTSGNGTVYSVRIHGDKLAGKDTVDFYFMPDNANSYSDMAALYRSILKENGTYSEKTSNTNTLLLELLGAYDYTKSFLGVPVESKKIMTEMSAAAEIVEELSKQGIGADVKYLAAVNGGYRQSVADSFKIVSLIGNKADAKSLKETVNKNGGKLYYDISFTAVYNDTLFDGFSRSSDSIGKINTKHSAFFEKDSVSFYYVKDSHFLLTPLSFSDNMSSLLKDLERYSADALSLRHIGNRLYSDADDENFYTKAQTAAEFSKASQKADDAGVSLMYGGGNEYILKNASYITDVYPCSNSFAITDSSVPFYQMAVCGYIPFSYGSLGDSSDRMHTLLFSIATGAKIKITASALNSSELKATAYVDYYNTCWSDMKDDVINECKFAGAAVKVTAGKELLSFEYICDSVSKSVFSDGITVYVNYSETDQTVNGKTVPSENYLVIGK